jgi:7-cyano-7-deazaguanine reductase
MNATQLRRLLATAANPDVHADYVVGIEAETPALSALGTVRLALRYVPDKRILRPACLDGYLAALARRQWISLEGLALALRDDLDNELVPRWLELSVHPVEALSAIRHRVLVEDRQPHWHNPTLLARLTPR